MNGGMTLCRSPIKQSLQSLPLLRNLFFFFSGKKKILIYPFNQSYLEQLFLRALHLI